MKKRTRILAMFLAVIMTASLICIPGLADETEDPYASLKEGTGYLAIGDSITRGYAASEKWDDEGYTIDKNDPPNHNCRRVTGSYPLLVADTLGLSAPDDMTVKTAQYWPIAQDAVTTAFIIDLLGLEDNYTDTEYLKNNNRYGMENRYKADLYYFGDEESIAYDGVSKYGEVGHGKSIRELVAGSSLITIGIGMSDVFNRARSLASINGSVLSQGTDGLINALKDFVSRMYEGYELWKNGFPLILDYFKDNVKDDAIVIIIGAINPMFNMTITDDIPVPVGTVMSTITELMNSQYKKWAKEYGFEFLDISNVETGTTTYGENIIDFASADVRGQGIATHPTPEGYAQIARMIVDVVDEQLAKNAAEEQHQRYIPEVPKTYIQVDLGRFQKVDYVKVDGIRILNYSVNDYVLTIPWLTTTADTLAVEIVNEDGSVTLLTYYLKYDHGYSVHRIYESNDILKTITTMVKTILSFSLNIVRNIYNMINK